MAESNHSHRSRLLRAAAFSASLLPQSVTRFLYRLPVITPILRLSLNRAAPEGLTPVTISAGALAGMRVELDLKSEKDFWLGTFEPGLQKAVERFIKPGMTVFDVGANIGYISLGLARRVGRAGYVVAFEPQLDNVARLRRNLALNALEDRVEVVQAAVGDVDGVEPFLVHASTSMGKLQKSKGRAIAYSSTTEVPVITLDDWIQRSAQASPDFVKIDVEGGEGLVLKGAARLIGQARPILLIEIHGPEAGEEAALLLQNAGYRLYRLRADGQTEEIASNADLPWKAHLLAIPERSSATSGHIHDGAEV